MGTISLPISWADFHRAGHPPAFAFGQPDVCPLCPDDEPGPTLAQPRAPKVTTRRAAVKRQREHDTGHVVVGIGFAFECSCGEHGKIRRDRSTAMQEGREHAAGHTNLANKRQRGV